MGQRTHFGTLSITSISIQPSVGASTPIARPVTVAAQRNANTFRRSIRPGALSRCREQPVVATLGHIWGSPKTCLEKLEYVNDKMGADEFIAVFSYGSMSVEVAEANTRLFAEKVLPRAQGFRPAEPPLLVS